MAKRKIKLVSPKMSLRPMDTDLKRLLSPSLSLLSLASLTPNEYEVIIEDENIKSIDYSEPADLVGITVNVDTAKRAYEISKRFREKGVKVILGGIHVSASPEESKKHSDSICIGEGIYVWNDVLKDLKTGNLKRIYCRKNNSERYELPTMNWEFINRNNYLYTNIITASKGCPYCCDFCYNSCEYIDKQYKMRNMADLVNEIERHETKHIMFIDDNLIGNIEWTKKLLRHIKHLNLSWNGAVSANIGNHPELLDMMKETGCKSLFIGFETINNASLMNVNKKQNRAESYEKTIKEIHEREIMINASIVFGFDNDHSNVFSQTVTWLVENKISTMTAHILTPYPGTVLFKKLEKEKRIISYDWNLYNTSNVVFKPRHMTEDELYNGYIWAYNQFYSLQNIFKRIPDAKNQIAPYLLFNLFYRKYGKITCQMTKFGLLNKIGKLARKLSYNIN
ncbi:MAG: radical SAM protein [Desulfamplus sp.]|nr:radical SAM protein [Desulfamplus sp.]